MRSPYRSERSASSIAFRHADGLPVPSLRGLVAQRADAIVRVRPLDYRGLVLDHVERGRPRHTVHYLIQCASTPMSRSIHADEPFGIQGDCYDVRIFRKTGYGK